MADFEQDDMDLDEEPVVVMTDEEGNEYYYREEVIIPLGDKRFAILVPIDIEEEGCGCGEEDCGCDEEETDVFIARIDVDESGEEVYVDPTDEEFEEVRQAYEDLLSEEESEA
ncbi:MAG TPA: DUF1292 domain-containing protein [Selenomonadales bacterium]|nr:DUF1292 domain-containing protein [Selenomonadales bacterium]